MSIAIRAVPSPQLVGSSPAPQRKAAVALIACFLGLVVSIPAFASEQERLSKGEILVKIRPVKGMDIPAATVRAVVEAPVEKVWAIINLCSRYTKTMMRVKKSKELSRKGNVVHCDVLVDMPWPIDDLRAITRAVHTIRPGAFYKREWKLVKGDYKRNTGSWTLTPFAKDKKRTMVVYKAHAVPNISVPKWLQRAAAKRTFPNLIKHLRKQVKP
ncbi:MAG: hypothetical protein KC502_14390 [Myxococcales bacterium]|nr:hypothetical protein [Myxococcales bacterium]